MKHTFDAYMSLQMAAGKRTWTKMIMTELVMAMSMAYEYAGSSLYTDGDEVLDTVLPPDVLLNMAQEHGTDVQPDHKVSFKSFLASLKEQAKKVHL